MYVCSGDGTAAGSSRSPHGGGRCRPIGSKVTGRPPPMECSWNEGGEEEPGHQKNRQVQALPGMGKQRETNYSLENLFPVGFHDPLRQGLMRPVPDGGFLFPHPP